MANDKFRKMKLRPKAKAPAEPVWDTPKTEAKRPDKRTGHGRRNQGAE